MPPDASLLAIVELGHALAGAVRAFAELGLGPPPPAARPFAGAVARLLADPARAFRLVPPDYRDDVIAHVKLAADATPEQLDAEIDRLNAQRVGPKLPGHQALLALIALLGEVRGVAAGRPGVLA